jgi:prepilin-type N-terminal cleavage/methylation domain-containing protein/prepilin-type processing-associated H-X9-DG protein
MSGHSQDYRRPRGFTLIELLVELAVITLLISLLLPAMAQAREQGRRAKCASNLKQIFLATRMYTDGNAGWVVHAHYFPDQLGTVGHHECPGLPYGEHLIAGGLSHRVWDCPNNPKAKERLYSETMYTSQYQWVCDWSLRYKYLSYGANGDWQRRQARGLLEWYEPLFRERPIRESAVRHPQKFITFSETNRDGHWDQLALPDLHQSQKLTGDPHPVYPIRAANVGFFDGHVEWFPTWRRYPAEPAGVLLAFYPTAGDESAKWRRLWNPSFKDQ